jgi:hypothetical protein
MEVTPGMAERAGLQLPGELAALNRSRGHRIDAETCLTGSGERMDRHWVVGVVADHLYSRN